jgi:outer membrane protein assembly factor BamB
VRQRKGEVTEIDNAPLRKPIRLWPGAVAAVLILLARLALPIVMPQYAIFGVIGAVVGALAIVVWWLFFSRALWSERLGAVVLMIVALLATSRIVHQSVSNGMMGMMLPIYGIPVLSVALVAGVAASRRLSTGARRLSLGAAILLACGALTLTRTGGITGDGNSELHWRWTPSPEERLLAEAGDESSARAVPDAPPPPSAAVTPPDEALVTKPADAPALPPAQAATATPDERSAARADEESRHAARDELEAFPPVPAPAKKRADWPGFRGPNRDSIIRGVLIETDWSKSPPVQLWRRPIGPGWSSFAVQGDVFYTQEQRGDDEIVAAYKMTTGEPMWRHRDPVRFWESNGGAGPRATPTLNNGRVYAFGATGILNALDAASGSVVWSRNAATDTSVEVPGWGFAGSPLVVDDEVVVAASGRLAAYDAVTGRPRWLGPAGGGGYSSPHLVTIDGVAQILLLRGGSIGVAPADGTLLWEHKMQSGGFIVQPAVTADGDILIDSADAMGGKGMRRIAVSHGPGGWNVEERWTSTGLKPYFNDFVVHKGHAFGFDGSILACIDLGDGKRKWKGGRYGHGQLVLLPDQDLLLVLSEDGELALVAAASDQFRELARFPAIAGKTWNHPVLVGDILLVRNGEEMAAFRLTLASR